MKSCSDDVRHSTGKRLAQFHRGRRTVSRGLLRTIQQSSLRDNPPSVSGETTSRIWSTETNEQIGALFGHNDGVTCVAISESTVVSGSYDKTVILYDFDIN
ncbi:unnamed protein product [Protopolystoma xenopodis]|uniref:Uncharacterized protein n=1 Tax=Protopolystoma xenopodis TaxID=117903 RepID=A0A448XM33_9PLAT|nr:unnamed protein product [Protopolystoma xenopodis]